MSNLNPTSIAQIDAAIQVGRGAAASVLGQAYLVYRLNAHSTGQLEQASNQVTFPGGKTLFPAYMERTATLSDIETNWMGNLPLFKGTCNALNLQVGDLLVETGYGADGGAFTFAFRRPATSDAIFIQTPLPSMFSRSENNPTKIDGGRVPYGGMIKPYELFLTLTNGVYTWSETGTPAAVRIGLQSENKKGSQAPPPIRLPTDVQRQYWNVYAPNLPGVEFAENDLVTGGSGDRYAVRLPQFQFVGLQGVQLLCERLLT